MHGYRIMTHASFSNCLSVKNYFCTKAVREGIESAQCWMNNLIFKRWIMHKSVGALTVVIILEVLLLQSYTMELLSIWSCEEVLFWKLCNELIWIDFKSIQYSTIYTN